VLFHNELKEQSSQGAAMSVFEDLLNSDFQQCFEQMRHYDDAFQNGLQFTYTGAIAIAGFSGTLLQIKGADSLKTVALVLFCSWLAGVFVVMSLAKNRVYFAKAARYVNQVRDFYLRNRPEEFEDHTKMYRNWRSPAVFDPGSTQTLQIYLASALDSFLFAFAVSAALALRHASHSTQPSLHWFWGAIAFGISVLTEVGLIMLYWHREDSRMTTKTR
jgi:hypothetical protein